ncbi:MAG TPA: ATP-binding protein [Streptosporangiaceae bacterium]
MPTSARAARVFVTETLSTWDLDDLAYDAATIVSELATNAIVHAPCHDDPAADHFHITLAADSVALTITVTDLADDGPTAPFPGEPRAEAESGRGLGIVAAYSADWGWRRQETGKVVWATLGIPGAAAAVPEAPVAPVAAVEEHREVWEA